MNHCLTVVAVIACAWLASRPADAQDLRQKLAAAKEAAARNQQALRSYSWIEKSQLLFKGEVKNTKVGTSHPSQVVLNIPSSKIEVRITKSNDQKLAP